MLHKTFALVLTLTATLGLSPLSAMAGESAKPATVVVYRADESVKSKRVKLDVFLDQRSMGRLSREASVEAEGAAGEYTLGTSIAGTEPLTLNLKPGETHYVHAQVKVRGNRVDVTLVEVEDQVAKLQQPALDGTI